MRIAHIRHTLTATLDDFKSGGAPATHVLSAIEALVEEKMMPIKERPSFSEWTSDHVRDNLHKLNPQPVQQDIPDLIAGALGVSRGTAYDMMREALAEAQPQPKPVAWMCNPYGDDEVEYGPHNQCENCMPLYTSPPAQRTWVGLTDEEIDALREKHSEGRGAGWRFDFKGFARAIEAKLKEKNNG